MFSAYPALGRVLFPGDRRPSPTCPLSPIAPPKSTEYRLAQRTRGTKTPTPEAYLHRSFAFIPLRFRSLAVEDFGDREVAGFDPAARQRLDLSQSNMRNVSPAPSTSLSADAAGNLLNHHPCLNLSRKPAPSPRYLWFWVRRLHGYPSELVFTLLPLLPGADVRRDYGLGRTH
jgi:hypothetical protein